MIRELATLHEAGDCVLGFCEHPSHYLEDAVVDLRDLLGDQGFCDPLELRLPIFL